MVEHLLCKQGVKSSNLFISTFFAKSLFAMVWLFSLLKCAIAGENAIFLFIFARYPVIYFEMLTFPENG